MKEDDDRHCSECKHYEICANFYMYCNFQILTSAKLSEINDHAVIVEKTENEKITG